MDSRKPGRSMTSRSITSLLFCLALALTVSGGLTADAPLFSVRFRQKSVIFNGKVDSTETAEALSAVVRRARPDLTTSTEGMTVDSSVTFPRLGDIKSLLAEIGLSTHEGVFEIWPDRVVVGGLTDSQVTQTALKIRVEPVLEGRSLINHICIVGTEELPKVDISLGSGSTSDRSGNAAVQPNVGPAFEVPGVLLEKLFPMIVMLNSFDRLEGKDGISDEPIRTAPPEKGADSIEAGEGVGTGSTPGLMTPMLTASPVQEYEILPSVRFSRNASILQSNQTVLLDDLAKRLLSPDRAGAPVYIEAVIPDGGSAALNDYLAERRGAELVRLLEERGLDPELLSKGVVRSPSSVDDGEVRLRVEIIRPPVSPDPAPSADVTGVEVGNSPLPPADFQEGEPVEP